MKHLGKLLTVAAAVGLVTFGCKPEATVDPKKSGSADVNLAGENPHDEMSPLCTEPVVVNLMDGQGNYEGGDPFDAGFGAYGSVEAATGLAADGTESMALFITAGYYWVLGDLKMWVGDAANVPLKPDGTVNVEGFGMGASIPLTAYYSYVVPMSSLNIPQGGCATVCAVATGYQSDFFGNVVNATRLWSNGNVNLGSNGKGLTICPAPCSFISTADCYDIDPAHGRTCVDIQAVASTEGLSSSGPWTFTWKDAAGTVVFTDVNSTGISTYNACPNGTTTYTVSLSDSRSVYTDVKTVTVSGTPTCSVTPPCDLIPGNFRTQTQGGWGSSASGNNPGAYRDANFAAAFPNGVTIGTGNRTLKFTTSQAVDNYLPQGGSARVYTGQALVNPTSNQFRSVFAGQLLALSLSVGFDNHDANFGASQAHLSDLVINGGAFDGQTVGQILAAANAHFSGQATVYSPAAISGVLATINENFVDGTINNGSLRCP